MNEDMLEETNLLLRLLIRTIIKTATHFSMTIEEADALRDDLEDIPHFRADAS